MRFELPHDDNKGSREEAKQEVLKLVVSRMKQKYGESVEKQLFHFKLYIRKLEEAFGSLESLKEKKILDLGCGSIEPERGNEDFKPWFSRLLQELGAKPVGIDIGSLEGEEFEHYQIDLTQISALDFLEEKSFDGIFVKLLFDSPKFHQMLAEANNMDVFENTKELEEKADEVKQEIQKQVKRLLKDAGKIINFDTSVSI